MGTQQGAAAGGVSVEETFGQAVRRLRGAAKLSLRGLAKLAYVDPGLLSKVENGIWNPSAQVAQALDKALNTHGELIALAQVLREQYSPRQSAKVVPAGQGADLAWLDKINEVTETQRRDLLKAALSALAGQRRRPGFGMVGAFAPGGSLIGFAYGDTFDADRWWRSAGAEPEATAGKPKFAVFELIVDPAWQGQGIASALMSALLGGRTEPYATLCSNPAAKARAIYDKWGWAKVGTTHPEGIGEMDVLVKPLSEQR